MKLNAYAIYDVKAGMYSAPFFHHNDGIAHRGFGDLVNDPRTNVNKHPGDYSLFKIGVFDDSSGEIVSCKPEQVVQGATVFINPDKNQLQLPGVPTLHEALNNAGANPLEIKK